MDWIKVEDQLPPIGKPVLLKLTYPKGTIFNCRADPLHRSMIRWGGMRYNDIFISYEDQYNELEYVSHWMEIEE
jgi:hypothetical protein